MDKIVRGTTPHEPRLRNAAETKERILLAAVNQFAEEGYAGARIDVICRAADINTRMLYHYFGDKAGLYVAVLEHVLGGLRKEELDLDVNEVPALEGLLKMFDFIFNHFGRNPELIKILSFENLMKAEFLRTSRVTPLISSPVIAHIRALLKRGATDRTVRPGIDPLHLYVLMVGMSYFHRSNGHTLSIIFETDVFDEGWDRDHYLFAADILRRHLAIPTSRC